MRQILVAGTREHMEFCHDLIHFETYGTLPFQKAIEHIDGGLLKFKEVSVLPLSETLTVIELTPKGRRALKALSGIWNEMYVPSLKEQDWTLQDAYEASDAAASEFALSRERFEQERKAGKLAEIIARCPPIGMM